MADSEPRLSPPRWPSLVWRPVLLLAGGLAAAIGVPRQAVAFAAGFGFEVWRGLASAMAAQMPGCAIAFLWARALAGPGLRRRIATGHGRRLANRLLAAPFRATLMLRLLPVGNNLALNLAAAAAGLAAAPFLDASLLGYLPQTVIFVLLGGGVAIGERARLALGLGLFAAAAGLGLALWRAAPNAEALERVVDPRGNRDQLGRRAGVEIRPAEPCRALECAVLVQHDPWADQPRPGEEVGELPAPGAIFPEVEHGRRPLLQTSRCRRAARRCRANTGPNCGS